MVQPALRLLESRFPGNKLVLVTRAHLAGLFGPALVSSEAAHPVISLPPARGWREVVNGARRLSASGIRRGVLFTNSMASALMFRLGGVRHLTGYRRDARGFLMTRGLDWPGVDGHQVDAYVDLAAAELGIPSPRNLAPRIAVPEPLANGVYRRLLELGVREGGHWIGISPFTAYGAAKEWPQDRFRELVRLLAAENPAVSILLFGGPADRQRLQSLAAAAPDQAFNLASCLSLAQAVAAVSQCRVFVSNDSGMMHVAMAVNTPVAALFGPTDPRRVAARDSGMWAIHHETPCAPCSRRQCDDHRCMNAISVAEVRDAVLALLKGAGEPA